MKLPSEVQKRFERARKYASTKAKSPSPSGCRLAAHWLRADTADNLTDFITPSKSAPSVIEKLEIWKRTLPLGTNKDDRITKAQREI